MYVSECMRKEVITTTADTTIYAAQRLMLDNHIHRLPVVDEKGNLIGLLTDRRLRMTIVSFLSSTDTGEFQKPLPLLKVKDIMVKDVLTISPNAPASQAADMGRKHEIGALPVVDEDGKMVGIITTTDLIRTFSEMTHLEGPGAYLRFIGDAKQEKLPEVIEIIHKRHGRIKVIHCHQSLDPRNEKIDIYIDVDDIAPIEEDLNNLGYSFSIKDQSGI